MSAVVAEQNLEAALQKAGNPVDMLRNSQIGRMRSPWCLPNSRTGETSKRPGEHVRALRSVASHDRPLHRGPGRAQGALRSRRQQLREVQSESGQAVRRLQLRRLRHRRRDPLLPRADNKLSLVGRPSSLNWVQYHIETGKYKATAERDERSFVNKGTRRFFRYQVQGPHALKVMEKVLGKPAPGHQVLQHERHLHRRARRARAASRHGGPAGLGAVRPLGTRATQSATPSCRPARNSGFAASARERTRRAASNRGGSPRRFRRSIRGRTCSRTASG